MSKADARDETFVAQTADIVAAHVANNSVAVSDLPMLIDNIHGALGSCGLDAYKLEIVRLAARLSQ